ncbi:IclR family transcriptional regulator [Methylobrevis pamukkalensis]|uniref:Glycerol operon regulatory protein n=1 Tax=Methylobrevis pamukkalensis TaxID=1439726 RepID=A0A1E3H464_9HYPH|nr:IclR family transcriptional regulator [Methylobrevis pamukkalensis]ODN71113.1 Glycerol operon regulatory protein [Methylobrevis pamukkalensis]
MARQTKEPELDDVEGEVDAVAKLHGFDRAVAILEFVARQPSRIADITRSFGLPWATIHRTVAQLERAQFLKRDPESNRYSVGSRLWLIGSTYVADNRLVKSAQGVLEASDRREGVVAQVVERIGLQSVVLHVHDRPGDTIAKANYGFHFDLHLASKGHVLLAAESDGFVEEYLTRERVAMTDETVTEPEALRAIVRKVRAQGYAITIGDVQPFVASAAAPIFDGSGRAVGCLCFVTRRAVLKDPQSADEIVEQLLRAASAVSMDLGWKPAMGVALGG